MAAGDSSQGQGGNIALVGGNGTCGGTVSVIAGDGTGSGGGGGHLELVGSEGGVVSITGASSEAQSGGVVISSGVAYAGASG